MLATGSHTPSGSQKPSRSAPVYTGLQAGAHSAVDWECSAVGLAPRAAGWAHGAARWAHGAAASVMSPQERACGDGAQVRGEHKVGVQAHAAAERRVGRVDARGEASLSGGLRVERPAESAPSAAPYGHTAASRSAQRFVPIA